MFALPEPRPLPALERCPRCDYDRSGVAALTPCPECGSPGGGAIELTGVPNKLGGSVARRTTRVIVIVGIGFLFQIIFITIAVSGSPLIGILLGLLFLGAILWLLVSSPRERGGSERFIITPGGVTRLPRTARTGEQSRTPSDAIHIALSPGDQLAFESVGAVWAKVRVLSGTGAERFSGGFRCASELLPTLARDIAALQSSGNTGVIVLLSGSVVSPFEVIPPRA